MKQSRIIFFLILLIPTIMFLAFAYISLEKGWGGIGGTSFVFSMLWLACVKYNDREI